MNGVASQTNSGVSSDRERPQRALRHFEDRDRLARRRGGVQHRPRVGRPEVMEPVEDRPQSRKVGRHVARVDGQRLEVDQPSGRRGDLRRTRPRWDTDR